MLHYVGFRMRVTLQDSRSLVGTFMAFDKHMNMVLGDTEEFRRIKAKKGQGITEEKVEKRTLGLIILRGDAIVSLSIEGPPPPDGTEKLAPGGPGTGKAAGRGVIPMPAAGAQAGLAGPIMGVGGPAPSLMMPRGMPMPMPMSAPGFGAGGIPPPGIPPGMMAPPPRGLPPRGV